MKPPMSPFQRLQGEIAVTAIGLVICLGVVPRIGQSHFDRYNSTITAIVAGKVFTGAALIYPIGNRWLI
jgi:hypothetical protein